ARAALRVAAPRALPRTPRRRATFAPALLRTLQTALQHLHQVDDVGVRRRLDFLRQLDRILPFLRLALDQLEQTLRPRIAQLLLGERLLLQPIDRARVRLHV